MDSDEIIIRFKMVLFGSEGVGKTSVVERFINDRFDDTYISTLGYNVYEKQMAHDNKTISLMIYDIGGQEKFRDLRKKYAEGADIAFIMYDITNRPSFASIYDWKEDLIEFAGNVPFIIIGNKVDLEAERQVPTEEATRIYSELGALGFFETSAKTGIGVEDAFNLLAMKTYDSRFK